MRKGIALFIVLSASVGILYLTSLGASTSRQQPYRCFEEVNLAELIKSEGLPQCQNQPWGVNAVKIAQENRFFDGRQEARDLIVDDPGPWVGRLCDRLRTRLAQRCDVTEFSTGIEHCAAEVRSPSAAVTGPGGVYQLRPVSGRLNLFASRTGDGKKNLILTATEWAE
jgi:hypothetical protein